MNHKNLLTALMLAGMCSVAGISHAAGEPSVQLDRPGSGVREIKTGDNVPDEYQRPALAIKDWKAKRLKAPGEDEQWVEIIGKYALVNIPTGTITDMNSK